MRINVHVNDKIFCIQCGDGAQRIRWLGDAAVLRCDQNYGMVTGTCKGLRFENKTLINGDGIINEQLKDDSHIYVILTEHFEALTVDPKGKKKPDEKGVKPKSATGARR